ncbi:MAG: 2-amino-4-hydroxy-6-hydroxymethyldihydropteridine diphosphokinase [Puniceicoccales bacterium]|jgi:2-amino-4-hydroxy-6-hydroxymethyldihydropteridine diphosphokinase|nr:2-amino-4-hydroxy-6-hydroxymethyldihydropteridine diphosphokinase [Puniceicoccales bacterium]
MAASDSAQKFHASFLSLGTNLGDKDSNLRHALALLAGVAEICIVKVSSIYRSAPQLFTEQEDFLNCACEIKTSLTPIQLLELCKSMETSLGRQPTFRYGPRLIDIDILLFDDLEFATPQLLIPHPELVRRNFVLTPLHEIAPHLRIFGQSITHWLDLCKDQRLSPHEINDA